MGGETRSVLKKGDGTKLSDRKEDNEVNMWTEEWGRQTS